MIHIIISQLMKSSILRMQLKCFVSGSQYTHMSQCQTHNSMENELCLVANQEELLL